MTQIKKITDKQGNDIYLRTHTKAVVDDNGYTVESRLQAMQDEINSTQLEIGAVPSDLTPTENSTNWVTSGGVYNTISPIDEELYGEKVYNTYTEGIYVNQSNGAITTNSNWALTDYIPCVTGDTVRVLFRTTGSAGISMASFYNSSKSWNQSYTTNGYTNERTVTSTVEGTAYVRCGLYLPNIESCVVYINNKIVWNYSGRGTKGIANYFDNIDDVPTKNSKNLIYSGGVYPLQHVVDDLPSEIIDLSTYSDLGAYINWTNNRWQESSNTKSKNIPIVSSRIYQITGHVTNGTRYALLTSDDHTTNSTPSYATGGTPKDVNANTTVILYPPADAKYLNITYKLSSNDTTPQSILETYSMGDSFAMIDECNRKIQNIDYSIIKYQNVKHKIIDARTSSATFGEVINATNDDWGCTQYIDLYGAKYVKYFARTYSTSNNYAGITGTVFYNSEKEPLTDGVRLITYGTTAKAEWITQEIPSGARYMRIGLAYALNQSTTYYVIPYKITTENVYGVQETLDEINNRANKEEIDIVRNSRYSADSATSGTVGFLHFSDIHGDEGAAQKIRAYYDKYSSYINDMISTGDVVYYYAGDGIDFYINNNLTDALLALGNHDGALATGSNVQGSADWDAKGAQWDYETYYAPYISGWNVTQPTDAATNYLMYYYKDYTTPKVRLIVLDVMHQDSDQLQWFQDTLADAITNDYTVVVASHYVPNTYTADYIVKRADGDKTTFHSYASNSLTSIDTRFKLNTVYADAVETFIGNGGKFAVWLCGHYHLDYFTYSDTHPNILFCAINQAGYRRGGSLGYRIVGDHCANMVTIHPALGVIKIHRIGLTTDKYLRPINVLVYDYINKKVISNY